MDHQKRALQLGAAAIAFALFLRLLGSAVTIARGIFQDPQVLSFVVFLQTGRVVRYPQAATTAPTEPQAPSEPEQEVITTLPPPPVRPVFNPEDLDTLSLIYGCDYRPDLETRLLSSLDWDLCDGEPAVLIVHTHGTEAYTPTADTSYTPSGDYRTLDENYNMISIGDEVARILEAGGISVLHDRSCHDHPSYNGSYTSARKAIAQYLEEYPSIRMVLDIHRDAVTTDSGQQLSTSATVGGQESSQIMLVIGTDEAGNHHPNWQTNLALALKLTAQLERENPGITRPIYLRSQRFNMDMTAGSLLVEVGASGDTHEQAIIAANVLANAILALAKGTSQ